MPLGSYSHIWNTAIPEVWGRTACSSETTQQLHVFETTWKCFYHSLKCRYISYNQTTDSSWYHSNAHQKEDGTESSVQKERRVWDSPPPGVVHIPWAVEMWIRVLQVCTATPGPNLFWRLYYLRGRFQPHFFSMSVFTKIRNFLILIFSQFALTVRQFQRWF